MAEYRGLTIRIGADTGKFTAAMKAVSSTINSTQYQLNQLKRALALDPGNTGTAKAYIGELQSQAVAARSKIAELSREMENIGGKKTKASSEYATIEELAKHTDDATLAAKRATEAYYNATDALAQWYTSVSKTQVAQDLGITFNAKNNDIEEIRAVYDLMVESGEKTREQADAELAQLERLKEGFKELKNAKSDADKVDAFHKDELAAAQLEAQLESLAKAQTQATQDLVTNRFEESLSGIRNLSTELENAKARFEHLDNALKLDPTNLDIARQRSEALAEVTRLAHDKAKALADAISTMDDTEFARIAETSGNLTEGLSKAKEAAEKANKAVAKLRSEIDMNKEAMDELAAKGDKDTEAFRKLSSETDELEMELKDAKQAADQATEALTQQVEATLFDNVKTDAAEATEEMARATAEARTAREELSTSMFMALQEVGQEAKQALDEVVSATTSLDDALTDVKKTVDTTEQGYESLKESAVELSKVQPIDASTILQAEALGGQLGFMADEVEKFSEVATGLDVATNMSWEQASTNMARFFNIMGTGHDEVENYGSAIVELGNNYATTESEISDMALRIAGAGAQLHLSEADVLGLATALTSVGLSAEAGGSSISQIMVKIDKAVANGTEGIKKYADDMGMSVNDFISYLKTLDDDALGEIGANYNLTAKKFSEATIGSMDALETWASTANMTADEFVVAWKEKPIEALTALFSGMDAAAEEGSNLNLLLEELGITTIRQSDVARRVASASELTVSAVKSANDAYKDNTALSTEVERRNESLSAQMDIMANSFDAVKAELGEGLLPIVKTGVTLFQDLSNVLNNVPTGFKTGMIAALGSLAAIGTMYPVVHQLSGAFTKLAENVIKLGGAKAALSAFGGGITAFITNPITLAVAAFGALGVAAFDYYNRVYKPAQDAKKAQEDFEQSLRDTFNTSRSFRKSMTTSKEAVETFGQEAAKQAKSVEELSQQMGAFNKSITDIEEPVEKSNHLLGEYRSVIDEFAGKGADYQGNMAKLEWALDGVNEALGTNFTAQDILTDKYQDEMGEIDNLCSYIDKLIEKRQLQARADAAQEAYTKAIEQQFQAQQDVAMAESALEEQWAQAHELYREMHDGQDVSDERLREIGLWAGEIEKAEQNLDAAKRTLDTVDESVYYYEDLMKSSFEATVDESERIADVIANAFTGWDIEWLGSLEEAGIDLDTFAQKAEDAGLSVDDFLQIRDDPSVFFRDMVNECGGDIDKLIAKIQEVSEQKVEIDVDTSKVTDAKKTLDEQRLSGTISQGVETTQTTKAVFDKAEAEADVQEYKSNVEDVPKDTNTTAKADTSDAEKKFQGVTALAGTIPTDIRIAISADASSFYSTLAVVKANANVSVKTSNAAGGIRYHADGMILNRPTWIGNRDIAGEAGAEAIIPLTNRRYVQPFADTVADGMLSKLGEMSGTTNNYVINGITVAPDSALAKAMDATFDEAKRLNRMGRR